GLETLQLAHSGEERGRLDEPRLRLLRGLAGVLQRALDLVADLADDLEVLLAHLVETLEPGVQGLRDRRDGAALSPRRVPALGVVPARGRLAHLSELGARESQLVGGTRHLPVLADELLHALGELGQIAPAGRCREAAQPGDLSRRDAVVESAQV